MINRDFNHSIHHRLQTWAKLSDHKIADFKTLRRKMRWHCISRGFHLDDRVVWWLCVCVACMCICNTQCVLHIHTHFECAALYFKSLARMSPNDMVAVCDTDEWHISMSNAHTHTYCDKGRGPKKNDFFRT